MVLAHVYNRLSNIVSILTVHVFKDDWNRPTTYQLMNENPALDRNLIPGASSLGNVGPPQLASPGAPVAYSTPLQKQNYRATIPPAVGAQSTYIPMPASSQLHNGAGLPSPFVTQNLNPDIMSLLGTTKPPISGASAKINLQTPTPSNLMPSAQDHMTTRTDPDGASRPF